jgi:hypothetical protein
MDAIWLARSGGRVLNGNVMAINTRASGPDVIGFCEKEPDLAKAATNGNGRCLVKVRFVGAPDFLVRRNM